MHKGYGLADRADQRRVATSTVYNIASLTKPFTAAAIMRLVDLGRLSTSDSLARFLTDVPEDKRGITVHQLLTHTSGLARDIIPNEAALDRDEVVRRILAARMRAAPGEGYAYSGAGYQLLGAIIEIASGYAYDEWLEREFFRPAGLTATDFAPDADGGPVHGAKPHTEWQELPGWWAWTGGWRYGSGNIVSTAHDLYLWRRHLGSEGTLSAASRASLFTPHTSAGDGVSYGYGWFLTTSPTGASQIYHGGDNMGYHSELRWYPERDRLVVVLTNLSLYDDSGFPLGLHKRIVASAIERILEGDSVAEPPPTLSRDASELRRYQGNYELDGGGGYTVWLDGDALRIAADGQHAIDALLDLDAAARARTAELSARSHRLIDAMADGSREELQAILPEEDQWIIPYWLDDWSAFIDSLGAFRSANLLGTRPLPWDDDLYRSALILRFANAEFDYQFTWQDGKLYESLSEVGTPHAVILPLAPLTADEFATWDLVSASGNRVRFRFAGDDRPTLLVIGAGAGEITASAASEASTTNATDE